MTCSDNCVLKLLSKYYKKAYSTDSQQSTLCRYLVGSAKVAYNVFMLYIPGFRAIMGYPTALKQVNTLPGTKELHTVQLRAAFHTGDLVCGQPAARHNTPFSCVRPCHQHVVASNISCRSDQVTRRQITDINAQDTVDSMQHTELQQNMDTKRNHLTERDVFLSKTNKKVSRVTTDVTACE